MTDNTELPKADTTTVAPEVQVEEEAPPVKAEEEALLTKNLKELQKILTDDLEFVGAEVFTVKQQAVKVILNIREKNKKDAEKLAAVKVDAEVQTTVPGPKGEQLVVNPTAPKAGDRLNERTDVAKWQGKQAIMKEKLWRQPLVQFMIPLGFGEKRGAFESVILNGYRLNIMKGVMVEIPKQVAEILANSYQMLAEAGKDFELDRSELVKEVLK